MKKPLTTLILEAASFWTELMLSTWVFLFFIYKSPSHLLSEIAFRSIRDFTRGIVLAHCLRWTAVHLTKTGFRV